MSCAHVIKQGCRGFTLIELLVVISIITVLSSVVFWNQSAAIRQVSLSNAVQETLIRIREAQVYGVGVRVVDDGSGGGTFDVSYGIHVEHNENYIILFVDKNGDDKYSGSANCVQGVTEECLNKFTFAGGVSVSDICGQWSTTERCASSFGALNSLSIVFTRPNPQAHFSFLNNGNQIPGNQFTNSYAKIKIVNSGGVCRMIQVYGTGQVTASEAC